MGTTKPKGPTVTAVAKQKMSTTSRHFSAKRILAAAAEKYKDSNGTSIHTIVHKKAVTVTPFQSQVYVSVCLVPEGKVTTYKEIATHIQCKSSQAVGQALKRKPWAPEVPCHRVISSDMSLGGFFGATIKTPGNKLEEKVSLLRQEGVRFRDNGRVDPECVYRFN
jgi:methylated-DNA-[protein]-cysteine S-methyltransferase